MSAMPASSTPNPSAPMSSAPMPSATTARSGVGGRGPRHAGPVRPLVDMHTAVAPVRRPLVRLDPGWLFLGVGIVAIAATVLIPAQRDLELAQWERDKALAIERHRTERVANYGAYLSAVNKGDTAVLLSLAATQLTKTPSDKVPISEPNDPSRTSASVFPALEPAPMREPPHPHLGRRVSTLERWTTDPKTRLWLLAGGILCILIGLLPAARR